MDERRQLTIGTSADLLERKSVTFAFRDSYGLLCDGFAFRFQGELFAFKNQCRHQPLTLDYGDNDFFTDDGQFLLCRNHGALFEPKTGKCVAGPCTGASLRRLEIHDENGILLIDLPSPDDIPDLE